MKAGQLEPTHLPAVHLPVGTDSVKYCVDMVHILFVPSQCSLHKRVHGDCADCAGSSVATDGC